jgi:hypothetical protein
MMRAAGLAAIALVNLLSCAAAFTGTRCCRADA